MARYTDTIICYGCGLEILWGALVAHKRYYCCQDCLDGRPCTCGERLEAGADRRDRATMAALAGIEGLAVAATALSTQ